MLLPAGDAGLYPAAHPRPVLPEAEYTAHLDNCALFGAIDAQAYVGADVAAHLAAKAVQGGYSGGAVVAGDGDYGYRALYTVIYPASGLWHLWAGYRRDNGEWVTIECSQHRDVKTLRWVMCFTYNARLCDVNPAAVLA